MELLTLLWWNVHNFAHFDSGRAHCDRWPKSREAFEAKAAKISKTVCRSTEEAQSPDIIVLSEVTGQAAEYLAKTHFPEYSTHALDMAGLPTFELAVFYRKGLTINLGVPISPPFMPRNTRPMATFDLALPDNQIRFFGCHWQARRGASSDKYRTQSADFLSREIYRYLHDERAMAQRNVIVVGDLNTEPFGSEVCGNLNATRSRVTSRGTHHTDHDVHRARLYNASWRLIGETRPYDGTAACTATPAGTYFFGRENTWHTFDQILVSGGLVSEGLPHLCENACRIIDDEDLVDRHGRPMAFQWAKGGWRGCSDHLPIFAALSYNAKEGD